MTEAEAIAYVTLHAQTNEFPCIETSDVSAIVQRHRRAVVWAALASYKVGDKVQPTTPNGHFYECVAAGESDSQEPDWTTRENSIFHEFATDLIWQECAIDVDGELYNLRNAIHECWTLKSAKSAGQFDISIDQQKWNRSQVHDHCLQMARSFYPID